MISDSHAEQRIGAALAPHPDELATLAPFLASGPIVDTDHPAVALQAAALARDLDDITAIARRTFLFVRDTIAHSGDTRKNPVTCRASEVLLHGTGYCYAKSHLLAALLRANAIAAGLCYQRLSVPGFGPPYCLHGLNAVFLPGTGWYRVDARGNKPGVAAEFCPPVEKLAFALGDSEERDFPGIYAEPLPAVVKALGGFSDVSVLYEHLPDQSSLPEGQADRLK